MTTTAQTPVTTRTCPPSAVVDMIVRWDQVQAGDLVLYEDVLIVADEVRVYEDDWQGHKWLRVDITYTGDGGRQYTTDCHGDRLTAVRRYTEGISERDALVIAALDEAAADRDERARDARQNGHADEEQEHTGRPAEYRAERDRREAGRG